MSRRQMYENVGIGNICFGLLFCLFVLEINHKRRSKIPPLKTTHKNMKGNVIRLRGRCIKRKERQGDAARCSAVGFYAHM